MEEDDEMEVEEQNMFDAYEIDLNYEFEAAMFFDFTRPESEAEAWLAQQWFHSAQSYPHSPFAEQMIHREKILAEELSTSLKAKDVESVIGQRDEDLDVPMGPVSSSVDVNNNGIVKGIFNSMQDRQNMHLGSTTGFMSKNNKPTSTLIADKKSCVKPSFPRSSTLMKPTLSQLAKQNWPHPVVGSSEKSLNSSSGLENRAPKRQKLEGGQLREVCKLDLWSCDVAANNPLTHLAHKAPKQDGLFEKSHLHPKMKLTIPTEPVLQTARRAHRIRAKSGKELEQPSSAVCHFKARPLNKNILEAPSLPFPKKINTKLTDLQGGNDGHKSMVEDNFAETRRLGAANAGKQSGCDPIYTFKAHPQKTFASKGDQVSLRNKRGTMAPVKHRHIPPIDLFSKLSLKSEHHPKKGSHLEVHRPISIFQKAGRHSVKEKPPIFGRTGTWTQVRN